MKLGIAGLGAVSHVILEFGGELVGGWFGRAGECGTGLCGQGSDGGFPADGSGDGVCVLCSLGMIHGEGMSTWCPAG